MAPSATGLVDRPAHASEVGPPRRLADAVAELERDLIAEALQATGGNKVAAARRLGIARATLYEKLALYGLGIEARPGARTGEARR
jgi:DNA-binding NtrC family response regulator